jgi:hypothetical protein
MKPHLTERELIEYEFKLASQTAAERTGDHLRDCHRCRDALEQLKRRFSALDLLREEAEVSEDLISQVVEQASEPVKTRVVSFSRPAWIGAAAAVLLMAALLTVSQYARDKTREPGWAKQPTKPPSVEPARAKAKDFTKAALAEAEISEQPPFAPASAIELVTLPRRESVQLTIYNSTFQTQMPGGGYGGYGGRYRHVEVNARLDEAARRNIREQRRRSLPAETRRVTAGADLTLVRERRNLTLKKGWNWLQFMWANTLIDPTSLHLEPLDKADKIDIQQLVFPARLRELGRWLIRSEVGGQVPFEIPYFTSGLSWRAFYMGTLSADEKKMDLAGYVRVSNNSGDDYEDAQTRLIVGQVHLLDQIAELARRKYPYGSPAVYGEPHIIRAGDMDGDVLDLGYSSLGVDGRGGYGGAAYFWRDLRPKEIRKEGLSEYFLYTIEGTETIPDKWGKRLLSFDVNDIEVKSLYKYDEERYGQQTTRFVAFTNNEEHNLGKTPIPNGDVRIYSLADEKGYLSYVGGTNVKYIPVDEEVELNLGAARLVTVEPKLMDFQTENHVFDRHKNISGWDEIHTWKMEVVNTRTLPVEVEITRGFGTAYWTLQADIPYEHHDVTHARFKLTVQPRSKRTFDYTVTTYHGVRQEQINE